MEEGHSKQIVALSDKAGIPLAEKQEDLTPLQRHVITLTLKEEQEEVERRTNNAGGGGRSRAPNPARKPRGGGSGQTTTYVNEKYE